MNKHIERQLKTREKNLKFDFLPSMIEIIEKPANKVVSIILFLIISFIIVTVIWACFFKIDISITAQGSVSYEETVVNITSLNSGDIIFVGCKEGHVNAGDIICGFSSEAEEEALLDYQHKLKVAEIKKKVYEVLYEKYKNEDYTSIDLEELKENCLDEDLIENEEKVVEEIVEENDLFLSRLEIESQDNQLILKKNQILSVSKNINELDSDIMDLNAKIKEINTTLDSKTVKASKTGTLVLQDDLYEGKTLKQGDVIGYIIPENKEYIFTAYIADEDITEIKTGDKVDIKIQAYYEDTHQVISGVISDIGDVPLKTEDRGTVYKVEIMLNEDASNLKLGMEGTVDIITGKRNVMDYFLEPLIDGVKGSMREK